MVPTIKIRRLVDEGKAHSQTGPFGTQLKASDYVSSGVPVINVKNVGMGEIIEDNVEFVSEAKASQLSSHVLQKNDIVFGRKGAIERHGLVGERHAGWLQGSDCIRLRISPLAYNPIFVSFFFRTKKHQQWMINYGSFGATMGTLNQDIVNAIELPDLPREAQDQIASVLVAYDDLIANNERRIALLAEMAEEIYKEWFVRYRFPGHEQRKMVNGLPEGWKEGKLGDVITINMGQSPKSEFYNNTGDGLPFHQGVKDFGSRFVEHLTYCTSPQKVAQEGDILLSVRAPVGRLNIADQEIIIGRGLGGVRHKKNCQSYCYYLLRAVFHKEDAFGNGAVFNAVSKRDVENIKLCIPDEETIRHYNDLADPFDKEIQLLGKQNKILKQTRDLLLPRLLSGKLSVDSLPLPDDC